MLWERAARVFILAVCRSSSCTRREGEEVHRGEGSVPLAFRGRWLADCILVFWLLALFCLLCSLSFSRISAENGRHRREKGRRWVLPKLSASISRLGGLRRLCFGEQSDWFGCAATATPALYCVSCCCGLLPLFISLRIPPCFAHLCFRCWQPARLIAKLNSFVF